MSANVVLTLAQMRDQVRRILQIIPPVDFASPGAVGAVPPGQPDPDNPTINQMINAACDALNRLVRCGPIVDLSPIGVPPAPPGKTGPLYIAFDPTESNSDDVNEINNATWIDSITGLPTRLKPYAYYQASRYFTPFLQFTPSRLPIYFQMEGNNLSVLPPPLYAGQIILTVQEGLQDLVTDSDTIAASTLGPSYQTAILYYAAALISARMATDVEANDRFQKYYALAQEGYQAIYTWKMGYSSQALQAFPDLFKNVTLSQFTNNEQSSILNMPQG